MLILQKNIMINRIYKKARRIFCEKSDSIKPENKYQSFKKVSYSQSGEDLIIDYIFKARNIINFTYLDIGANHPCYINNTFIFYLKGCRGVNIEPNPKMVNLYIDFRPDDVALAVGISDQKGEFVYYEMDANELNTFSKEQSLYLEERGHKIINQQVIPVHTIDFIIQHYFNNVSPNVIFIDAEGMDLTIVKSIDFEKYSPEVLCIETISYELNGHGVKDSELINFVLSNGYFLYADTNINSIFVKKSFWFL